MVFLEDSFSHETWPSRHTTCTKPITMIWSVAAVYRQSIAVRNGCMMWLMYIWTCQTYE